MSKRHKRKPGGNKSGAAPPASQGTAALLSQSIANLRQGKIDLGLKEAAQALKTAHNPALVEAARQILVEAHFRAAMQLDDATKRLEHLDTGLHYQPDAPRLHFYRGIALWQMGRLAEAREELDTVALREPDRPGLAFLRQLAQLAAGQTWKLDRLSAPETNTLKLVQGFLQRQPAAQLSPLLQQPLVGRSAPVWESLLKLHDAPTPESTALLDALPQRNVRKPVARILEYYLGAAALRHDNPDKARLAWSNAKNGGLSTPWLYDNLAVLLREQAFALAQEERWGDMAKLADGRPAAVQDATLDELLALAFFHLGYDAAGKGDWFKAATQWRRANALKPSRYLSQNLALAEETLENWEEAAVAWRELARRRPRKTDHPDYLTDAQVAAIWSRAAACYQRLEIEEEVVTCLRNAIKYNSSDTALRLQLVDVLMNGERDEAAENELGRILEIEPQNVKALIALGTIYDGDWGRDSMPIWR
ncbi:MAG: tetratricopeptide repeat protein, partial [Chloroflexi bacterium]|nr:tetratricopeptide repeat protein [Chloroflexota bacterium]